MALRAVSLRKVYGSMVAGVLIGEIDLAKHRARALYGRVYRHAVRTGLLARYSAESAA